MMLGIAATTLRLLRGRIEFTYDAFHGGEQWHVLCNGLPLCGKTWSRPEPDPAARRCSICGSIPRPRTHDRREERSCRNSPLTKTHIPGETELPMPMCYRCFVVFNSPTVVVLP